MQKAEDDAAWLLKESSAHGERKERERNMVVESAPHLFYQPEDPQPTYTLCPDFKPEHVERPVYGNNGKRREADPISSSDLKLDIIPKSLINIFFHVKNKIL